MRPGRGGAGALLLGAALALSSPALASDERVERLPPEHRLWLEDEVAPIIAEREREIFLSLETIEERNAFINVFWRKRDPIAATPQNEFKEEHYRRLEHADQQFREILSVPGRKTDRGRMYVILGEPRSRERFDNESQLVTTELWFYQGDPSKGLPPFFNLLFFKPQDVGTFRLYSPVLDGPGKLLRGQAGAEPQRAFDALYFVSPELARAALTFNATEPVNRMDVSSALLGTETMIARIEESPTRAVRTDYLDGWLRYGKRVSTDYSFNFVPSRSTFVVMLGRGRTPFLQYAVELDFENFPVETDEAKTKYYTTVDVSLELRDRQGNLVLADDKESYVELSRSQLEALEGSAFSYQDGLPIVPGHYNVSVILRNRVLHQYTVAEREVSVLVPLPPRPASSDLVLGFQIEEDTAADVAGELETFEVGGLRVHPATNGLFAVGDTLYAVFQVLGAAADDVLEVAVLDGDTVLQQERFAPEPDPAEAIAAPVSLAGMIGGNYVVRARLLDSAEPKAAVLLEKQAPLTLSPRTSVPRPAFTARRSFDSGEPGLLSMTLGDQLWSLGRFDEARTRFEEAVGADNPLLPMARWKLAGAYVRARQPDRALELLVPLEPDHPQQYEVVLGLGLSYYLKGELESSARFLERALDIRPPSASLLNALADVYLRLGETQKARPLLERSLEIDPSQESIAEKLAALPGVR